MDSLSTNNKHLFRKCKQNRIKHDLTPRAAPSGPALEIDKVRNYHVCVGILTILFPSTCVGCGALGPQICARCSLKMRITPTPRCLSCGNSLSALEQCPLCTGRRESLYISSCWNYEAVVAKAIWSLKYKRNKELVVELCSRMSPHTLTNLFQIKAGRREAVFIPVPLHENREKERGYNQSSLLAQTLSTATSIPTETKAIVRVKETKPQAKCSSKTQRIQNIQKAFKLAKPALLREKTIILVDDVVTTGSTVREIVREIRKERVGNVFVFCLAREEGVVG